ncbi:glycosyltransferase family 4 protein [Litorisediminicola beolgyonensis]|uniref:Glycosyltransferase family 4 protein n=1 Tax=Litorisediminicola beolgyonensis TaxID=1173614 RepID=A0ABW3ZHS3_9RHOB
MSDRAPPPARLLDLTRLVSRAGRRDTGVDRVEAAYLERLLSERVPLFGLVRTALGYLLLDGWACAGIAERRAGKPRGKAGPLGRALRRGHPDRADEEALLRRQALARAAPPLLGAMLTRHLPRGAVYLNTGHTNLSRATMKGLKATPGLRVATLIHDTIPLDFPQYQRVGTEERFRDFLIRAWHVSDLLIANSQKTEDDLRRHLAVLGPMPEIVTALLGVPRPDPGHAPEGPWTGQPYFVALGTIEPRKNHRLLLDLWDKLGAEAPPLLIVGQRGWADDRLLARLDARPPQVFELGALGDAESFALLRDAAGLLFPSHAEGFGLPPVEAAALGCPVIASDLPVLRESLGDIPVYASVNHLYLWENAVRELTRAQARGDRQPVPYDPPDWDAHFNTVLRRV